MGDLDLECRRVDLVGLEIDVQDVVSERPLPGLLWGGMSICLPKDL